MEVWSIINEKYSVSDLGRFWSVNIGIMKTPIANTGYPHLNISHNGEILRIMCHVEVAKHFVPNPQNKRCVNHINGIKADCRAVNLEWVSYSENHLHAIKYLGKKGAKNYDRRKSVIAYKEGLPIVIEQFGIREMARFLEIPYQAVQTGIKIKTRKYFGWRFESL